MEVAVEVDLPVSVAVARLMGSAEGFGSGGSGGGGGGGVVVGEVRWRTEGACGSGGKKDDIHAVNVSTSAFWRKIPDSEIRTQVCQTSSLQNDDASKDRGLGNMNSHPSILDLDAKPALQRPGKIIRNNTGFTKRSGMVQMEISKSKTGLHDGNGISPELASSSASCNISDKSIPVKQKNSWTGRRGDKRNSKVKHKNRCDSFSLKNGLVGFNSAAGGNNFFGMYGLKPDVYDITNYDNELPLDELLRGSYSYPNITKENGKKAANTSDNVLQSVRKACSVLQAQKFLQAQNCPETDNSCIGNVSDSIVTVGSAVGQSDGDKGDSCTIDQPSSDKVQESEDELKMSTIANSSLYQPKDILERLALPPPKDLDVLLSDASKTTSSSKNSTDPRLGKQASHRTGLPPFPWSHSFAGHNKLGSDAVKLSASRTICQGRWVRIKNSTALQKGSADLLKDFESLTFDQSLVPSVNCTSDQPKNEFDSMDRVVAASGACSTSKVPSEEHTSTHAAAQTLLDMAAYSTENPSEIVKLLKRPSLMPMKTSNSKSKAVEKSEKFFGGLKSTIRPTNPSKVGNNGFPSKKLKLSTDTYISHPDPMRKSSLHHRSTPLYVKSPPMKLFRDANTNTNSYGVNIVKKSYMMKSPGSSSQHHKFRKP